MPIYNDGSTSTYPGTVDDFGQEFVDDIHQKVTASRFNTMSDGIINLQNHTLQLVNTGQAGVLTHNTGAGRPVMVYKVYSVAFTGADSPFKTATIPGPAFTTYEKSLFSGTPLASGNSVHVWVRKLAGDSIVMTAFEAAIDGPIADTSGDSGIPVSIRLFGSDFQSLNIRPDTYVLTLLVTKN